ncbi:MAG: hypothetical protein HOI88_02600 [Phycisphaerae bacterium]|jgi:hypothetical protein|nr:hypothetical protein [Phycisphaerae bacterium]
MFLRLTSLILCLLLSTPSYSMDEFSAWLQKMGCDELLASYLEERLEDVNPKVRLQSAKDLANVYAVLLSRATANEDIKLLERANALLDKMPEAGTTDLRLQLLRAAYLSAEQMIERYRLRYTDKSNADAAAIQLTEIASKLAVIKKALLNKKNRQEKKSEELSQKIGLANSLIAWSHYYIAMQMNSTEHATKAVDLFAKMLHGDRPTLQSVSIDLKQHEQGARAILGIALCKDILNDPNGPEVWLEVIETSDAHAGVRMSVPMWRFFGDIEQGRWINAIKSMPLVVNVDKSLILRLAAVHALEHYSEKGASELSALAIATLIDCGQLAMVSEIVELYGLSTLDRSGFIANFISADIAYRDARAKMNSDEPTEEPAIVEMFDIVLSHLKRALLATNATAYSALLDDCYFTLAFSYYYTARFVKAIDSFVNATEGKNAETSVWMTLVCLERLQQKNAHQLQMQVELTSLYLSTWPKSQRATQLLLHQTSSNTDDVSIDKLLAVSSSDPNYQQTQRKASRLLYNMWAEASQEEQELIGNRYVSIASLLMFSDSKLRTDKTAIQRSAVRAMRVLEVALHNKIRRNVAAEQAFVVIDTLDNEQLYDFSEFNDELKFRAVLLSIYNNNFSDAYLSTKELILNSPKSSWASASSKVLWQLWDDGNFSPTELERFTIGTYLLSSCTDVQYANRQFMPIALSVAKSGFTSFIELNIEANALEALRAIRILIASYPNIEEIVQLAAEIESAVGIPETAAKHWKKLLASCQKETAPWLNAKYNIALSLSKRDKALARKFLDQHRALYPEYGIEPYGTLLRSLHKKLGGSI